VRIFRPLVGTAIGAAVLGGGLALSLTAAGAATAGTHATAGHTASGTSASTAAARTSGSTTVQPQTIAASASPTAKPKHKCTNMPAGSQTRPGSGSSPAGS
jgi:ABC-type phosphate transport system substrate-binding protein